MVVFLQGTVLVECVVETDGAVRRARIARSLDARFGLDQAALEATKEWRLLERDRRAPGDSGFLRPAPWRHSTGG